MAPEIQIQRQIDINALRMRLRGMTDEQLLRFGKSARYMVSRYANNGKPTLSRVKHPGWLTVMLEDESAGEWYVFRRDYLPAIHASVIANAHWKIATHQDY